MLSLATSKVFFWEASRLSPENTKLNETTLSALLVQHATKADKQIKTDRQKYHCGVLAVSTDMI
jgi:hypothetical protein